MELLTSVVVIVLQLLFMELFSNSLFCKLKYFFLGLAHILIENGIFHEMYLACKQQQTGKGKPMRNNGMR